MALQPDENIGWEVHGDHDQSFRFESGQSRIYINDEEFQIQNGDAITVPVGAKHNIINTGNTSLKFFTIYAPPELSQGKIYKTKEALNDLIIKIMINR